jgi:predicted nucleic acid-binding protein
MPGKVTDASAVAAILFGEPEAQLIAERLGDAPLLVPPLFRYEIANICWKKLRRYPERRERLLEGYSLLGRMQIEEVEISISEVFWLADGENLTVYDASYLWLSRKLGLELVTLDRDLMDILAKESEGNP